MPGFRSSPFVGSLALSFVKRLTACVERFAFGGSFNGVKIGASGSFSSFARVSFDVYFTPIAFVALLVYFAPIAFVALLASFAPLTLFASVNASTVSVSSLCSGERRRFPNLRTGQKGKAFVARTLRKLRAENVERRKRRTVKQGKGKRRERRESPAGSGKRSTGRKADCVATSRRTGRKADCVENGVVFAFGAFLRRDAGTDGKSQETR